MSLITPFVICLAVGLVIGLAFGFGRMSATLHLLRNPPNKRIEIQRLKIGPVTIPWPEPFVYEPPQLQEAPAGEEEKLPGGLTGKTTGGGRKRRAEDDWANYRVNKLGHDPEAVYPEWITRVIWENEQGRADQRKAGSNDSQRRKYKDAIDPKRGWGEYHPAQDPYPKRQTGEN